MRRAQELLVPCGPCPNGPPARAGAPVGHMDVRMDSSHGRRLHQDATAVPEPWNIPGTSLGSSPCPCAGAWLCNPQARLQHRHIPGAPAAPHPLLPPAVFILRPGGIGCRPGREHQESGPWQTNQTPPKPGEPRGQRAASQLLPSWTALPRWERLLQLGIASSPCLPPRQTQRFGMHTWAQLLP